MEGDKRPADHPSQPQQDKKKTQLSDIFVDKIVDQSTLNIFFLTDWHLNKPFAEKLKAWYLAQEKRDVDLVVLGGDFDNLNEQSFAKEAENDESEMRISTFLTFLEFFCCPIYYIPGNHDPPTMFSPDDRVAKTHSLSQFSHNVHKRIQKVLSGLSIVGIGGSIPALKTNLKTGDSEFIWSSYPYEKDADMEPDLTFVSSLIDATEDQVIFLSHNGPDALSTTLYSLDEGEKIVAGAPSLTKFLLKHSDKILLNLHGHCHPGQGMKKLNTSVVLNGGAFCFGEFAKARLVKIEGVWKVQNCSFHDLNAVN